MPVFSFDTSSLHPCIPNAIRARYDLTIGQYQLSTGASSTRPKFFDLRCPPDLLLAKVGPAPMRLLHAKTPNLVTAAAGLAGWRPCRGLDPLGDVAAPGLMRNAEGKEDFVFSTTGRTR